MAKQPSRFDRKAPSRTEIPRVLVLCEDSLSAVKYLQDAAQLYRANLKVKVSHQDSCPRNSVRAAIKQRAEYNEIYCCFDRDAHEHFDEALRLANENHINTIVSYPCFEFWLLLHFQRHRRPYARNAKGSAADAVRVDLMQQEGTTDYAKGNTKGLFALLKSRLGTATENADWTLLEAIKDQNPNPSTQIHTLLARIEELGI